LYHRLLRSRVQAICTQKVHRCLDHRPPSTIHESLCLRSLVASPMLALAALALAWAHYATASATASCTVSSDSWMDNSLGQNPCRVAEFLSYPCSGGLRSVDIDNFLYVLSFLAYVVLPLSNGSQWYGPALDNPCSCNTVVYNLLSACSLCQGESQQGWNIYIQNCSHTYIGQYPEEILSTTAVPHWAYIDISGTNLLDINQAEAIGDIPETTEGFVSTATITATQTVLVTATASGTKGAGSSIVGPIVGGVVGGVAFVALVAVAGFYFMIRRKAPQIQVLSNSSVLGSPSTVPGSSTLFSGAPSPPTRHMTGTGGGLLETYEPRTQHTLAPSRFPNPHNNSVTMYVTPSNPYIQESGRNNMYRTM